MGHHKGGKDHNNILLLNPSLILRYNLCSSIFPTNMQSVRNTFPLHLIKIRIAVKVGTLRTFNLLKMRLQGPLIACTSRTESGSIKRGRVPRIWHA